MTDPNYADEYRTMPPDLEEGEVMGAECKTCGYDLLYEGPCEVCRLRSRLAQYEAVVEAAYKLVESVEHDYRPNISRGKRTREALDDLRAALDTEER